MASARSPGNNCVFTNNYIHHIGIFFSPWTSSQDSTDGGQGVCFQSMSNGIAVSNIITDCNYNAIGGSGGTCTNLIFWGNEIASIQNHGIQTWSRGYTEIVGNFCHDNTNGIDVLGFSMQLLSIDLNVNSAMIIANNYFSNAVDDVSLEMYNPTLFAPPFGPYNLGAAYVFNNVHDNSIPGAGGNQGWNNGDLWDTYDNTSSGLLTSTTPISGQSRRLGLPPPRRSGC